MNAAGKCTPERCEVIVQAIREGCWREQAAAAGAIARSTLYAWLERGEAGEEPFATFREQLLAAEDNLEREVVGHLLKASREGDWRAGLALMERKAPERWGRKDRHEVEHKGLTTFADLMSAAGVGAGDTDA